MKKEVSARRCENCGQPVLQNDSSCWHCGAALAPLDRPVSTIEGEAQAAQAQVPVMQIAFYAVMTAVTVLALLFVVRSIGPQPRLSGNFESTQIDKVTLAPPTGDFSIDLPSDWSWHFPPDGPDRAADGAELVDDALYEEALQPLFGLADDAALQLVASSDLATLALANSKRLGQLSSNDIVTASGGANFAAYAVQEAKTITDAAGADTAVLTLDQPAAGRRCRQHVVLHGEDAYLVAVCADQQAFDRQAPLFDEVLATLAVR